MSGRDRPVLVTGNAGFIGFHLARRLIADGAPMVGLDNLNAYYDPLLKEARLAELAKAGEVPQERIDLADHDNVLALFERHRPRVVVHLAAQAGVRHSLDNPRAYASSNLDGFLSILEGCRRYPVDHLVYASSSSVYGSNERAPFRESDAADSPISLYAATKRANELMARTYAHLYAIPATGLRFFTVYGPWGRPDMAYWGFTEALLEDREITLFNGGRLARDLTYVDDVVEAVARILPRPPPGGGGAPPHAIYNVGNHVAVPLERLVDAIADAVGRPARRTYLPMQAGDVLQTCADVSRLRALTGFAPSVPIEAGIARFVDWLRGYRGRRASAYPAAAAGRS